MASIIGFSIVNVKRALLQRSCGIYISRYRYIVWSCVNLYQTERYVLAIGLGNSWQLKVILLQLYNTLLDDRSSCATISFGLAFIGAYLVRKTRKGADISQYVGL